jgi:transcriptional regulator with XRE-family HTH domain
VSTSSTPAVTTKPRPSTSRLVRARVEAGLTQEELARETQISVASIGKYERGERFPRGPKLRRIADVTGRPIGWFFEEAEAA